MDGAPKLKTLNGLSPDSSLIHRNDMHPERVSWTADYVVVRHTHLVSGRVLLP
jgi:hypothetical protein